jgi:hypothetical protein
VAVRFAIGLAEAVANVLLESTTRAGGRGESRHERYATLHSASALVMFSRERGGAEGRYVTRIAWVMPHGRLPGARTAAGL